MIWRLAWGEDLHGLSTVRGNECKQEAEKLCILSQGTAFIALRLDGLHILNWHGQGGVCVEGCKIDANHSQGLVVQCQPCYGPLPQAGTTTLWVASDRRSCSVWSCRAM